MAQHTGKLRILAGGGGVDVLNLLDDLRKAPETGQQPSTPRFDIKRVMRFQATVMTLIPEIAPKIAIVIEIVLRLQAVDASVSGLISGYQIRHLLHKR